MGIALIGGGVGIGFGGGAFALARHARDEALEVAHPGEVVVDRGEADVGHLIELGEPLHRQRARRFASISVSPLSSTSRTMPLTMRSIRSSSMPRLRVAIMIERLNLSRSNGTRLPSRLITVSSRSWMRSKVVKRAPQALHCRRRRTPRLLHGPQILDLVVIRAAERTAHRVSLVLAP